MVKKICFVACICFFSITCISQTKPDFLDKYEYDVWKVNYEWTSNGRTPEGRPQPSVIEQFKNELNNKGGNGWEIDKIEQFKKESSETPAGMMGTIQKETISAVVILKRKVYDTKAQIEKDVAIYTKKYADSIRIEMQTLINSNTWAALGKNYKQEIVDEVLAKIAVLLEEASKKIIANYKK